MIWTKRSFAGPRDLDETKFRRPALITGYGNEFYEGDFRLIDEPQRPPGPDSRNSAMEAVRARQEGGKEGLAKFLRKAERQAMLRRLNLRCD
jgi:hypothetical protein